jgi:hypothetical protein
MTKKIFIFGIVFLCCGIVTPTTSRAQKVPLIAEGTYFSVYAADGLSSFKVLTRLGYREAVDMDALLQDSSKDNRNELARALDSLYGEVSDVLDIHSYNFHGTIRVGPNQAYVSKAFKDIFGQDYPERSFYVTGQNTIYISLEDMTLGMLAHEIAHALIAHYFVVPPPPKMQEILSGYVEYSLQKKNRLTP